MKLHVNAIRTCRTKLIVFCTPNLRLRVCLCGQSSCPKDGRRNNMPLPTDVATGCHESIAHTSFVKSVGRTSRILGTAGRRWQLVGRGRRRGSNSHRYTWKGKNVRCGGDPPPVARISLFFEPPQQVICPCCLPSARGRKRKCFRHICMIKPKRLNTVRETPKRMHSLFLRASSNLLSAPWCTGSRVPCVVSLWVGFQHFLIIEDPRLKTAH